MATLSQMLDKIRNDINDINLKIDKEIIEGQEIVKLEDFITKEKFYESFFWNYLSEFSYDAEEALKFKGDFKSFFPNNEEEIELIFKKEYFEKMFKIFLLIKKNWISFFFNSNILEYWLSESSYESSMRFVFIEGEIGGIHNLKKILGNSSGEQKDFTIETGIGYLIEGGKLVFKVEEEAKNKLFENVYIPKSIVLLIKKILQ